MSEDKHENIEDANENMQEESSNSEVESQEIEAGEVENVNEEETKEEVKEEEIPFHEHPRFKELISERNNANEEIKALRAEMDSFRESTKPVEKTFKDRAKEIDPEFGEWTDQVEASRAEVKELRQQMAQQDQSRIQEQINSEFRSLHEANKVPEALQAKYESELRYQASLDPKKFNSFDDMRTAYKGIHDEYSKMLDNVRRDERKKYVSDKKSDNAPSSQKGSSKKESKPEELKIPEGVDKAEYLRHMAAKNAFRSWRNENDL